jgi:hypothetical protein
LLAGIKALQGLVRQHSQQYASFFCKIHRGFEEAMTAHMVTIAYHENRKTFWDKEKLVIV